MKKEKKGFTLIELMVVIVIIGILAAIAIPKLFGMTAKAKAQEVGPAAGTWSKLQQAFITEQNAVGSFAKIGYTPPGALSSATVSGSTKNFLYQTNFTGTSAAATATTSEHMITTGTATFTASIPVALGECKTTNGVWLAQVDPGTGTATGTGPAINDGECNALTPQFANLR